MEGFLRNTVAIGRRASGRGWFLKKPKHTPIREYDYFGLQKGLVSRDSRRSRPHVEFSCDTGGEEPVTRRFVLELATDVTPRSAERFLKLCKEQHPKGYIGSCINRVRPGYVVEAGNLTRDKDNTSMLTGVLRTKKGEFEGAEQLAEVAPEAFEPIADENYVLRHSVPGVISLMSNGRDTSTTLWSVLLESAPHLDGQQVPFGRVVAGLNDLLDITNTVKQLKGRATGQAPRINSIRVLEKEEAHILRGWIKAEPGTEAPPSAVDYDSTAVSAEDRRKALLEKAKARRRG